MLDLSSFDVAAQNYKNHARLHLNFRKTHFELHNDKEAWTIAHFCIYLLEKIIFAISLNREQNLRYIVLRIRK